MNNNKGRLTIPTDLDAVEETVFLLDKWRADALRDCDGTEFPSELRNTGAKIYKTYYTTRKDNDWAKANPDEVQQCYIMTAFYMAHQNELSIPLMKGISSELMMPNTKDDIKRWWEVIDRSTGKVVSDDQWDYVDGNVIIQNAIPYHEYTVSFLAYLIWDPVHMYNAVTNDWKDFEHQITFDVRQPKTKAYSKERLKKFIEENPHVDVIRYTTFFHQFTLMFDELKREKFVDWYGYSASVSPYILKQFEQEIGYKFRPEYIIDQGYYNNQYRVPSKEYQDFMAFQRKEVCALVREFVDITHQYGKEAMMFLGDHWIGTEPFMPEFKTCNLDAVVGSVGNGSTLRLIADIEGIKYTEGRLLPYFFPDTFYDGGNPLAEAKSNWISARRALLRKPLDRIGYGGYLKLACKFPEFIDYVETLANEFRELYSNVHGCTPYCACKVAILNSWGKMRAWGAHMVHHALYQKQNYSYAGIIEILSGAPFDVQFISFDDIMNDSNILNDIDVLINVGDAYTAHIGESIWANDRFTTIIKRYIASGGGFIGIGEPSAYQYQGRFFQLANMLGVEKETGFTLNYDKYNWSENREHFILADCTHEVDFGEGKKSIYALSDTKVLIQQDKEVQMAVNSAYKGRCVYISGLPYSLENARILYRSIIWASHNEDILNKWYSSNFNVDVHAYIDNKKYCVVNNTYDSQTTTIYTDNSSFDITLAPNEIRWYEI